MSAIINGRGTVGIRGLSVVGAPLVSVTPLLDSYGGAAAAYSLRKLRTAYSGPVIRVRRGSDNQELNIGFDASGNLDTSALTSFVGANNGFVTIWYDQSGNGKNASQLPTSPYQPIIVSGGTILTTNGKPSIQFDGIDDFLYCASINNGTKPANFSTLIISKFNTLATTQCIIGSINTAGQSKSTYSYFVNRSTAPGKLETTSSDGTNFRTSNTSEIFSNNTQYLFEHFYSSNVSPYYGTVLWNGSIKTPNNLFGGTSTSNGGVEEPTCIGRIGMLSSSYLNGTVQEIVMYSSNKILDRTSIESNINRYYTIY